MQSGFRYELSSAQMGVVGCIDHCAQAALPHSPSGFSFCYLIAVISSEDEWTCFNVLSDCVCTGQVVLFTDASNSMLVFCRRQSLSHDVHLRLR